MFEPVLEAFKLAGFMAVMVLFPISLMFQMTRISIRNDRGLDEDHFLASFWGRLLAGSYIAIVLIVHIVVYAMDAAN